MHDMFLGIEALMFHSIDKGELPASTMRQQRAKIVRHRCVMPECNHESPKLSIVFNQCERNCPECDEGLNMKTMMPDVVAREIKPQSRLFHFMSSQVHAMDEARITFDWIICSDNMMDLVRQARD